MFTYSRTDEGFAAAYAMVERYIKMHDRPIWLYAKNNSEYWVDTIKPKLEHIAEGTTANQYTIRTKKRGVEIRDSFTREVKL